MPPRIDDDGEGFDVGTLAEWGRYQREHVTGDVRIEGRNRVMVFVGDLSCDVSAVALSVPVSLLLAHVAFPDGTPVDVLSADVTAACRSSSSGWTPPTDA